MFYYYFDPNPRDKLGQLSAERDEENVACLVRSSNLSALADLIKKNAGQDEGENDFMIHELKNVSIGALMTNEEIEADKQKLIVPDLNNYSNLNNTGALLLGTIDQRNELIFKQQTRDKQQAANSLTTLAMTKLYNPHLWYRELVDDILRFGDKLTIENLPNLPEVETEEEKFPRNYLLPSEIMEDFVIGVNRMSIGLEEESVTGKMTDVIRLLEQFFEGNSMGVFRQGDVMMPIWKEGGVFFTMDPRGRNAQGEPRDKDGAAAVMWFIDIPSLANSLRAVTREIDDFVIDAISIENVYETRVAKAQRIKKTTSGEDLWHHFPKLADGVWSIDGNIAITDEKFDEANRGKQSAAIAAMAIVFSKVYQPRQWTPSVLDEVIVTGDKLHSKCVERLGSVPLVNEIINEFFLSSRRIALTIKDCVQAGNLNGRPTKIQNLQTGIDNFFDKYEAGVLTARRNQHLAIWKVDNAYYALIPDWSITREEIVSTIPRVMRFRDTSLLVEYLLHHLGTEGDYQITAIDVLDWSKPPLSKLDPSPAIRPANLPPLNAYRKLGEARAILRGSYHQGDEIFPETLRGRQTAANCVVALGMSVVKSPVTWTKKTLDEILVIGSGVHRETRKARPTESRPKPKDIIRVFYMGVNVLTVDIEPNTVIGLVASVPSVLDEDKKKEQEETKEKLDKGKKRDHFRRKQRQALSSPILLEEGLRQFFQDNRAGILMIDRDMMAIWKDLGVYFIYDPKGRNDQGLPDSRGTSCVMWFACTETLYDMIFASIDPRERYRTFEICRVIVKNAVIEALPSPSDFRSYLDRITPPVSSTFPKKTITLNVEPLSKYGFVDEELSVLRGSLHMNHRSFSLRNRGLQSTAIAAVAVVVGLLHVPSTWTPELIDAVLRYGDSLYSESVRAARSGPRNLSPSELLTTFIVGDSTVTVRVSDRTAAGILHVFDLSEALAMFFRANCAGILHTTNLAVAVMQYYGKFYMLDPCPRNDQGRPAYDGAACMFKCNSVARMAKIFVANCNLKRPNVYTLNAVHVSSLQFFSNARDSCPFKS